MYKSVLIILDINGVIGNRSYKDNKFILYEGAKDFLNYCYELYSVGFYSSMVKKNLDTILKDILTPDQISKTICILDRRYTKKDESGKDPWSTTKDVNLIKDKFKGYKVLICDDDESKMKFNDPNDYIIVQKFEDEVKNFEYIKNEIINKLKR